MRRPSTGAVSAGIEWTNYYMSVHMHVRMCVARHLCTLSWQWDMPRHFELHEAEKCWGVRKRLVIGSLFDSYWNQYCML